jgi:hypothetical protein
MRCKKCNAEMEAEVGVCPVCGERWTEHEVEVEVLPPEERDEFQGITIEQNPQSSPDERGDSNYEYYDPRKRVYVRQINLSGKGGWLSRILVGLAVLAVIFLAFPFFFMLLIFFVPVILGGLFAFFWRRK